MATPESQSNPDYFDVSGASADDIHLLNEQFDKIHIERQLHALKTKIFTLLKNNQAAGDHVWWALYDVGLVEDEDILLRRAARQLLILVSGEDIAPTVSDSGKSTIHIIEQDIYHHYDVVDPEKSYFDVMSRHIGFASNSSAAFYNVGYGTNSPRTMPEHESLAANEGKTQVIPNQSCAVFGLKEQGEGIVLSVPKREDTGEMLFSFIEVNDNASTQIFPFVQPIEPRITDTLYAIDQADEILGILVTRVPLKVSL